MSRPIIDALRTIFIHVPKTGGISIDRYFREHHNLMDFTGHHSALELRTRYPDPFATYFKFAFVRNPWERLVSAFFFLDQGGYSKVDKVIRGQYLSKYQGDFIAFVEDLPSHPEFVQAQPTSVHTGIDGLPFLTTHFIEQSYWLCDSEGKLLVDFVGRFEQLDADFRKVVAKLGLAHAVLPRSNMSKHQQYRTHYTERTAAIVGELFVRDIELLGYRF